MSALTVRNLDPDVKIRLRVQAAQQGIAMEEAVRRILTRAANESQVEPGISHDLGKRIQARFASLGEIPIPARRTMRASPIANEDSGS